MRHTADDSGSSSSSSSRSSDSSNSSSSSRSSNSNSSNTTAVATAVATAAAAATATAATAATAAATAGISKCHASRCRPITRTHIPSFFVHSLQYFGELCFAGGISVFHKRLKRYERVGRLLSSSALTIKSESTMHVGPESSLPFNLHSQRAGCPTTADCGTDNKLS
ncbi:hypothetical protein FHG87_012880 [Trinorchestia longiramus]|nr:hypothetical protein FHG87_012880 [Trinorchestia longiramus]